MLFCLKGGVSLEKLFEYYLENDNLHFKYAKGEPAVKEQEFHDYNEFVFFIKGDSLFISKSIRQKLTPETVILIPKENFHQFCVNTPDSYIRCILGFRDTDGLGGLAGEVMNAVKVLSHPDKKIISVFNDLIDIAKSELPTKEKELYVHASLIQLLIFLKTNPFREINGDTNLSPVVSRALAIIDERYTENLSVKAIAELLYISPSTLSHKFSRELNISIYRYITKKRLAVAHKLIQNGESIADAAFKSGFCDYSCFYRLYKKYYSDKNAP